MNLPRFLFRARIPLAFVGLLLASPALDAKTDRDTAKRAWAAFTEAFSSGNRNQIQSFVGKTVCLEGQRENGKLSLVLNVREKNGIEIKVQVISPPPYPAPIPSFHFQSANDVRKIQRFTGIGTCAEIVGIIRSIDFEKNEIVVDPIAGHVTVST